MLTAIGKRFAEADVLEEKLVFANIATTVAEFAGIAGAMDIFGVSPLIAVPVSAVLVWVLVIRGQYRYVERFLLALCLIYVSYVISGFLVHPDWAEVFHQTLVPHIQLNQGYLLTLVAVIGTTIAPWMQFYQQSAIADEEIAVTHLNYERNVCDAVTPPRVPRKELNFLTEEQARRLLKEVKEHRLEALLTLAVTTVMRRGELLALRWQDINFTDNILQVKRAVSYFQNYGYVESEPKTSRSRRTIKLPAFVRDILIQHREYQAEQQRNVGDAWVTKGLVFTNAWGDYYSPSTMLKVFKRFLESIDMPHMRFHDLRHSAASILLAMKVHPKVVQEILGHSQITTTMDIYSHAMPSLQDDATQQWEDKFGKKGKRKGKK